VRADRRVRRHVTRVNTLRSVKNRQAATAGPRPGYGPLPTARARWLRARLSTARTRILDVLIDQPAPCTVSALSALTRHTSWQARADSIEAGLLWGRGPDPEGTERTSLQAFSEPGACRLDLLPRRGTPS